MSLPQVFIELEKIFSSNGYSLYMIGGLSRNYLLKEEIKDYDFVTNATPEKMKEFLDFETSFSSVGSVHITFMNQKVDITTLRKEGEYKDFRHPENVTYVKTLKDDSKRRDFTINALYINKDGKVFDYFGGVDDLKNHLISMIGDPNKRLQEDPLRILRALRFSLIYDFSITPSLIKAIDDNIYLLKNISFVKCLEEIRKMEAFSKEKTNWILKIHHVDDYLPIEYQEENRLNVIDLHCDTITKENILKEGLFNNNLHVSLKKMYQGQYMMQAFAIFLPLINYQKPFDEVKKYIDLFKKQMVENKGVISQVYNYQDLMNNHANKKLSALLTIEDAGLLEGKIENLQYAYDQGVRMITLAWNYPNGVGYPNFKLDGKNPLFSKSDTENGLTPFGIELVKKMNELGIIVDVSHLSDAGFYDCIKYSKYPIVASHSNSRSVYGPIRNMTDEMILALKKNGGVMGINYCPDFISNSQKNQIPDIVKHINHIKEIAGVEVIALGSDFDGIPTPIGMSDCTKTLSLKEALVKEGYTNEEINKIFHDNFLRVFKKVCSK